MVAPIIAMTAIGAASTLAQVYNSERGRRMTASERRRLEKLIQKLESPQFDTNQLNPPELKILEQYTPEVAQLVYEDNPKLVSASSQRAIQGKAAQDAALAQLQSVAAGRDMLGDVGIIKAINDAIEASGSQRQAILADMARQGVSPSSSAYGLMQSQAASESQKNMFNAALNAALAERTRRESAASKSADLGRSILGFETELERMNTDAINAANRRNTAARRQYLTNRANTLNAAQQYNIKERQRISEENARNLYNAQLRAQDLRNKQIEAQYRTERDKLGLMTGNARFADIAETTQGRNQAIQGLSNAAIIGAMLAGKQSSQLPEQQVNQIDQQGYPSYITPTEEIPLG